MEWQQTVTVLACAKPGACQEGFSYLWSSNKAAELHRAELPKDADDLAPSGPSPKPDSSG